MEAMLPELRAVIARPISATPLTLTAPALALLLLQLLLQLPSTQASNATAFAEAAIVAVEPIQPKK